jgi:glycoprotein endo-alpha-1,2-mannosidase
MMAGKALHCDLFPCEALGELPYANNSQLKMIHITSFNEWHEDTEIEPSVVTGPTTTDTSATGSQYSQGLVYQGFGTPYLDILQNEIAAAKPH